jgi:hypothetical protein
MQGRGEKVVRNKENPAEDVERKAEHPEHPP